MTSGLRRSRFLGVVLFDFCMKKAGSFRQALIAEGDESELSGLFEDAWALAPNNMLSQATLPIEILYFIHFAAAITTSHYPKNQCVDSLILRMLA